MKNLIVLIISFCTLTVESQTKFKIVQNETDTWRSIYSLVDENNKTIKVLDSASYFMVWSGFEYAYFAVVAKKGSKGHGWPAIDAKKIYFFMYIIQVLVSLVLII